MGEAARIFGQELTNRAAGGEARTTVVFTSLDGSTGHYRVAMSLHPTRWTYLVVRRGDQVSADEARSNLRWPQPVGVTWSEPECDITAQWLAMCDPAHPKDAMWVSGRAPRPSPETGILSRSYPNGLLMTNNPAKLVYFELEPTEDRLADVLGYVIPKSRLNPNKAYIIKASDLAGSVITEMLIEDIDRHRAEMVLAGHGVISTSTIEEAIQRRIKLST